MKLNQWLGAALASVVCGTAAAQSPVSSEVLSSIQAGRRHAPNELLVQFKRDASAAGKSAALGAVSAKVAKKLADHGKGELVLVKLAPGRDISAAMRGLHDQATVEFAEPNWIYTTQQVANPNDPQLSALWGMQGATTSPQNPYGSGALAAWNAGALCSSAIHVGIIDEGIMVTHPDLKANAWINPGDSTANGVDNDGNGFIDDINGWDFVRNDNSVFDGSADDHGTHVAGTVAGAVNNGVGVFGVCGTAKLISAKFLGRAGGTTADAISALNYLVKLKQTKGIKLVATNNSWGGGGYSQALADAISAAGAANILFIAAAGNDGNNNDSTPSYPASYQLPNVIAVAAIDKAGAKASWSNYGVNTVHIAAPGVAIISTVPDKKSQPSYASYSGTSMATPHVTGAAALYASLNPCATAAQIKAAILNNATADSNLSSVVQNGRRLNVAGFKKELACGV